MSAKSPRQIEDERLLAERAAEWVGLLKTAGDTERAEFADWLAESPRHVEEFLMTTALDRAIDRLPLQDNATMQAFLARASSSVVELRLTESKPVGAGAHTNPASTEPSRLSRTRIAAGLAAVVTAAAIFAWQMNARGHFYGTEIGEQRTVLLPDGSEMVLTASTQTRVRFSGNGRTVKLLAGEAGFKVAKDSRRPFLVYSAGSIIQAIGTQFSVLRRPSGTIVSVLEGAVSVKGPAGAPAAKSKTTSATLRAGDEVKIAPNGRIDKRDRTSELTVTSSRGHRLIFRKDTLEDIAAEFNRYNRSPRLVVEDDTASTPRYTGVFDANDPRSLLVFLREDPQIIVEERGETLVIRPR